MNRHCYQLLISKTFSRPAVVAENMPARGKSRNRTRKSRPPSAAGGSGAPSCLCLFPIVGALLGMSLCASLTRAQVVADPNAPGTQQPTILGTAGGAPLVNIQTPSGAGVSRNAYSRFDVEQQGAILNNSRTNIQTQLGGAIQGNPWLAGGSARLILNEVNSSSPSLLNGYVEVAGQRAEVVIANPSGIGVSGGGFINASGVTLTTGSPRIDNGNLTGYQVGNGQIGIDGGGLDASTTDYTGLIARSIRINAGIWANELKITAGAGQVDAANGAATPDPASGPAPAYAIDVAQLGGMYAGKISLVGTEAGVGVRNAGHIGASAGEVLVTADGRIENSGAISAAGNARLDGNSGIVNSGAISSQADLALSTRGDIGNSGSIAAAGSTKLAATGEGGAIVSTAESLLAAGVQADGGIGASGNLTVAATRQVTATGSNFAGGDLRIDSRGVDLSGSTTSAGDIAVQADTIDLGSATMAAGLLLSLQAAGTLRTDRAAISADQFDFRAADISNVRGDLRQVGKNAGSITADNLFDNSQGSLLGNGALVITALGDLVNQGGIIGTYGSQACLSLQAGGILNNGGGDISAGGTLEIAATALTNTGGALLGDRSLDLTAGRASGDGSLLSAGDVAIRLEQDFLLTGRVAANGDLSFITAGHLTNQSALEAGGHLNLRAAGIDNQAGGTISAAATGLTADSTLTNRGLIDGDATFLAAGTLDNLGTGRIYGDHIAIGAGAVNNIDEGGAAPVIAARSRLDFGAATINNREHALLFSAGDMAIGGGLDQNNTATGQAGAVNNVSATIEALGDLTISAEQITNTNAHFSTAVALLSTDNITEFQGVGSENRYPASESVRIMGQDQLYTPEGRYSAWFVYVYNRTVTETTVTGTDPAQILAGGALDITADRLQNNASRIIAGGAINGNIGDLDNTDAEGEHVITDSGEYSNGWREESPTGSGYNLHSAPWMAYNPPASMQTIALYPAVYQPHTAPAGTGTSAGSRSSNAVNGQAGPDTVVGTCGIDTRVPDNSMYAIDSGSGALILIRTDARFAGYRQWLSSDVMLNALQLDPAALQKRLGDGFYEQRLISEQVAQLTGRRFLDGYADDEAQYRALIDNGVTFAREHNLRPGIALTAEQMAQLTSDIVWLVEQTVTLADGSTTTALAPQVYVRLREGDLSASGALIAGNSLGLNLRGDLVNSGTLAGRTVTALTAENIHNLGGRILGEDIGLLARTDLDIGGSVRAQNSLTAIAGRDLNVATTTDSRSNAQGSRITIDRVAGLYVTHGSGGLAAIAGRDLTLTGAVVENSGSGATELTAGSDLVMNTVRASYDEALIMNADNFHTSAHHMDIGTGVQSVGDLRLTAGNDMQLTAASVFTEQGALTAIAGRDINLATGEAFMQSDDAHKSSSSGFLSSRTTTTRDTLQRTTALGTTLSGYTATVIAGRDIEVIGGNIVSTAGTGLVAGKDINLLLAAISTGEESHYKQVKSSGLLGSGGIGFTLGSRMQSVGQIGSFTGASASTVGSTEGDVSIVAGRHYTQTGSNVLAPQGSIDIAGQRVDITEARETAESVTRTDFRQSGLTVALTSPVVSALQTVRQMRSAAQDTKDSRMQALAGASSVLATADAYQRVQSNPQTGGGFGISITGGGSRNQTIVTETADTATASQVVAGRDIRIAASGAGTDSDLTLRGALVQAGNDLTLHADNNLNLLAAASESDLARKSSGSSFGLGVAIQVGKGVAIGITANGSSANGRADGHDLIYSNTQVLAGNTAALTSGGDTNLKGAAVFGNQVTADVGGNLNIESLQETSSYHSRDRSLGGSVTVGYGFAAGNASYGSSRIDSDYRSVTEQSGLKAGDGGFDVRVGGHTDLTGAVIASSDTAVQNGANRFSTGSLSLRDIGNQADYDAKGIGVGIGAGYGNEGEHTSQGTSSGIGKDSGQAASTTATGISGIAGNTSVRSGDTETGIQKIFDADRVQKEIDVQVAITQKFNELAPKAAADYANDKVIALRRQAEDETDPGRKTELEAEAKKWAPNGSYNIAMNIIIGAAGGGSTGTLSSVAKESLSWAANEMRQAMIKDSRTFKGICVAGTDDCISNASGISDGVNGDNFKLAGGRIVLEKWCANNRCTTDDTTDSGYTENPNGTVIFHPGKNDQGTQLTINEFIQKNPEWISSMGGHQGGEGVMSLLGISFTYKPGSIFDRLDESYSGTHDMLNSFIWYDKLGNGKNLDDEQSGIFGEITNITNIAPATPFAMSVLLPPGVWNAIVNSIQQIK